MKKIRIFIVFTFITTLGSTVQATQPPPQGGDWPVCDRLEMGFFVVASLRYEEGLSKEEALELLAEDDIEDPAEEALFRRMIDRVYELPADLPEQAEAQGEPEMMVEDLIGDLLKECERQLG